MAEHKVYILDTKVRFLVLAPTGCSSSGRVSALGADGWRFKSSHPDQIKEDWQSGLLQQS